MEFKDKFIAKLNKESSSARFFLEKIKKSKQEVEFTRLDRIRSGILHLLPVLLKSVLRLFLTNIQLIFIVALYVFVYTHIITFQRSFFEAVVLIWIAISFVTTEYSILVKSALFIVFPSYIIDGLVVDSIRIFFPLGDGNLEPQYLKTMMFTSLMGYVFISILKKNKTTIRSRFKRYLDRKSTRLNSSHVD